MLIFTFKWKKVGYNPIIVFLVSVQENVWKLLGNQNENFPALQTVGKDYPQRSNFKSWFISKAPTSILHFYFCFWALWLCSPLGSSSYPLRNLGVERQEHFRKSLLYCVFIMVELEYFSREKNIKHLEIWSLSATVYIAVKTFLSMPTRTVTNEHLLEGRDASQRVPQSATATSLTWQ